MKGQWKKTEEAVHFFDYMKSYKSTRDEFCKRKTGKGYKIEEPEDIQNIKYLTEEVRKEVINLCRNW